MLTPPARRLIRVLLAEHGMAYQDAFFHAKQYERDSPAWKHKMEELGLTEEDVKDATDDSRPLHVTRVR
jgi:hypothetical protein